MNTRNLGRLAAATLSTSALILIAGCGGSSKPTPSALSTTPATSAATSSAATTPSPDPTAQAKSGALEAYKKVIEMTTQEFATNEEPPELHTYAIDNAYLTFRQSLISRINNDLIMVGTPQSSPTITDLKMDTTPPSVTITDCYGGPNYLPVFSKDVGKYKKGDSAVVPGTSLAPTLATAIMANNGGHWQMISITLSKDKKC